ncbi:MAG TPA: hypothetical protein VKE51_28880 [Vicinamibacterales bacterium]|nr:hypothetical protein [Vicinamibacterales bacterium]
MPSFTAARLIAVARRTVPWLVGPAVLALRGGALELANPSACPGLLELASIAALRARPDLRVGAVFALLQLTVTTAALAAFVELLRRRARTVAIPIATAMAIGLGPLFPSALAPPWEAAAFGVCALAALVAASRGTGSWPPRAALAALALAGLLVPLWLLTGTFSAAGTFAACAVPRLSVPRALEIAGTIGWWLGPLALALAALGLFVETQRGSRPTSLLAVAIAGAATALASGTRLSAAVAVAPIVVVLWWLAALGLDELAGAIGTRPAARLAGAVILVLVPALATSRRVTEERDDMVRPQGHDQQTLRRTTTVLNLVPQEAIFVEEDATVDVLLRAAVFGGRRKAKPISIVSPQPEAVADALERRLVYAYPRRQADLSLRGFVVDQNAAARLAADNPHQLEGIAAITGRRSCQTIGRRIADFNGATDRIALSADSEAARGPAVIYLGGTSAGAPFPDGWSPRMLRGFGFFTFDQLTPAGSERLRAEALAAKLPLTHPILGEPFVIRFNLHRTPRAPLTLPVILGGRFPIGVVKLDEDADDAGRLTVCDAPRVALSTLPPQD